MPRNEANNIMHALHLVTTFGRSSGSFKYKIISFPAFQEIRKPRTLAAQFRDSEKILATSECILNLLLK